MFSGRITEEEMVHEHGRQYERLSKSGELEDLRVSDEWNSWKWFFGPFGATAIVLGLILAAAIFWALLHH
jgi:hypothetical protein